MSKNDARSQIPRPVVTPPHDGPALPVGDAVPAVPAPAQIPPQFYPAPRPPAPTAAVSPAITELAARAITGGAGMAREYAFSAAELCRGADTNPQARANARRLLRIALAHLEA
jgi:hypothetical protein